MPLERELMPLVWKYLGILPKELEEVTEETDVWTSSCRPIDLTWNKSSMMDGWTDIQYLKNRDQNLTWKLKQKKKERPRSGFIVLFKILVLMGLLD